MGIILYILIGALAGYIAGKLMKGSGFGFWINLLVGIVGGAIGGWILNCKGLVGSLISAVIGAVILLWVLRLIKK